MEGKEDLGEGEIINQKMFEKFMFIFSDLPLQDIHKKAIKKLFIEYERANQKANDLE